MKKLVAIMLIVAMGMFATSADAKIVSLSFGDANSALAPADVAGVAPAASWNNITGGFNSMPGLVGVPLVDDSTAATALSLSANSDYGPNSAELTAGAGPNVTMMTGAGLESIGIGGVHYGQLEVAGGVATEMGGAYDVYVYFGTGYNSAGGEMGSWGNIVLSGGGYTNGNGGDVPAGTALPYRTLSSASTGTAGTPVYDAGVGFIQSNGGTAGNYVMFPGITEETLVITAQWTGGGTWFPTVNVVGIQIVGEEAPPDSAIPEPAGLGLAGLALLAVRKRRS